MSQPAVRGSVQALAGEASDGAELRAESVTVAFSGLVALSEVKFGVSQGEIVGLIGPNGAGKTTLLNVLTGFQPPTGGRVLLNDREVSRWRPQRLARAGIARTFQGVRPFSRLSVKDNVTLGALGVGASRREARSRSDRLLRQYGLDQYASMSAGALPAGLQRRLGIARALASEPRILLLDEPAAGLNEVEGDELVGLIRRLRVEVGCAVVVVEHTMRVIMNLCDRLHVLDSGVTLATGSPAEVRANASVLRAYLGAQGGAHRA